MSASQTEALLSDDGEEVGDIGQFTRFPMRDDVFQNTHRNEYEYAHLCSFSGCN